MNVIFVADLFLVTLAFVYLVIASITDIKKREVPDWLCFSLIAIALATRLIASIITSSFSYVIIGIAVLAIFFILANIFYKIRLFGGGDSKLLMGLATCMATTPFFAKSNVGEPFTLSLLLNLLLIGALYGLIFSGIIAMKKNREFKKNWKENKKSKVIKIRFIIFFVLAIIAFSLIFLLHSNFFILLTIMLVAVPFISIFSKSVENIMIKKLSPNEIYEGDMVIEKNQRKILTARDIELLKKSKKPITIFYGIPFVPVFLLALIASLVFGDLLTKIILALI